MDFVSWLLVLSVLPRRAVDFVAVVARDDCPANFVVVGFVVRVLRGSGFRHLSRFMRVTRFAVEFLFVGSAFSCCVTFPVAPKALFCAGALCALVLFPILFVGVDQHGPIFGGCSLSLIHI